MDMAMEERDEALKEAVTVRVFIEEFKDVISVCCFTLKLLG